MLHTFVLYIEYLRKLLTASHKLITPRAKKQPPQNAIFSKQLMTPFYARHQPISDDIFIFKTFAYNICGVFCTFSFLYVTIYSVQCI